MEGGESVTAGVRTYPLPFGRRIRGLIRGRKTGTLQKAGNTALNGGEGVPRNADRPRPPTVVKAKDHRALCPNFLPSCPSLLVLDRRQPACNVGTRVGTNIGG